MTQATDLSGRAAVITGGAGGIGTATGVAMGRAGARVLLVDRDVEGLATAAEAVASTGAEVRTHVADVTRSADVAAYVAAALDAFGRLDILANNAAIIGPVAPLSEYDEAAFDRIMAVNVRGVFLGLRHALPPMLAQGSGSIVNTGSLSSVRGLPGTPAYNAAKHAVLGLTRSAAAEVAAAGVRVKAVLPGMIDTPMFAEVASGFPDPDAARHAAAGVSPQGRIGRPEEVAAVIAFLASDAASLVNGAAWEVDGGILATISTAQPQ
jgi:3alpha(or 20beta)-hydroxysteroid dehydrogenase